MTVLFWDTVVFKIYLRLCVFFFFLFFFSALSSTCCVGVEPEEQSEAFHQLFLPSVMDGLLSLASQLMKQAEVCHFFFKKKSINVY